MSNSSSSSIDYESTTINNAKNLMLAICGIIYLVFGSIGTVLNLIVFTRPALWFTSPCIPYLFASSLMAIPVMYAAILSRIGIGFNVTPFNNITSLCKLLVYISNVSISLVIWFMVGSCWDRWLSSSRNAAMRRISSERNTRRVIIITTLVMMLAYSYVLYCYQAGNLTAVAPCATQTTQCTLVDSIFLIVIQYVAPPLVIFCFGIQIYFNIRKPKNNTQQQNSVGTQAVQSTRNYQRMERIVMRMVIIQVSSLLICTFPMVVFRFYITITAATSKS